MRVCHTITLRDLARISAGRQYEGTLQRQELIRRLDSALSVLGERVGVRMRAIERDMASSVTLVVEKTDPPGGGE